MRKMKDLPYEEYLLIRDCKYQQTFLSMNSNSLYTCCTRNVDAEILKLSPAEYVGVCSDCIGSSCKFKNNT